MITLTLEINKKCNLSCNYCYVGDKTNETMDDRIAYRSVNFAIERINQENHKNRRIKINFLGGEPLLDFDKVKKIVYYCETNSEKNNIDFLYTITTNGTIFDSSIISFLISYNFSLKICLDGDEKINNLSRKMVNGTGSYKYVIRNLDFIKYFELKTRRAVQVSAVITKNNYTYHLEIIKHFHENLGFLDIDAGINTDTKWNKEELERLFGIYRKVLDYYITCYHNNNYFMWRYIENALDSYKDTSKRIYSCGAGIISFYINVKGEMFLCPSLLDQQYSLGNVFGGFSEFGVLLRGELKDIKYIDNPKCLSCKEYENCKSKGCFAASLHENKDIHCPDEFSCLYTRMANQLVRDNLTELEQIEKNARIIGPMPYYIKGVRHPIKNMAY